MSAKFEVTGTSAGAVKAIEDLGKAIDNAGKKADGLTGNTKKAEEMAKRLAAQADPTLRYSQQLEKLATAVHRGGLELGHAEQLAMKYRSQLDRTADSGERAFGAAAVGKLLAFTGGLSGVAAMFRTLEADAQKAADSVFNALAQAGELQQLGRRAVRQERCRRASIGPQRRRLSREQGAGVRHRDQLG